jgi:hypothetical protein
MGAGLVDPREVQRLLGDVEMSVTSAAAEVT